MKEKRGRPEKKTRPTSATSVRSNTSSMSFRSKMTVTWRDPNKEIIKSGWLYKQDSTGTVKRWRKKWFVLADFCLYYYKDSTEEGISGSIILPSYTVSTLTAEEKIHRKYAFKVEHEGMRTYYLSADSYKDMASWVTALQKSCHPSTPTVDKSGVPKKKEDGSTGSKKAERESDSELSKSSDSAKAKKKEAAKAKAQEDSDSEFGFNHVQPKTSHSMPSNDSKAREREKNEKKSTVPKAATQSGTLNNNRTDKSSKSPQRMDLSPEKARTPKHREDTQQRAPPSQTQSPHSAKNHHRRSAQDPRHVVPPYHGPAVPNVQPYPQHKQARRENGESAYFSDTSGATDNSNPNAQRPLTTEEQKKIQRQNSYVKLHNWVVNQKLKQQSGSTLNSPQRIQQPPTNFDSASEFSSVSQQYPRKNTAMGNRGTPKSGPPSSRRYRARTYNEYMDPMEVASSTISMPPIQTMNRTPNHHPAARTLPRPISSENVRNSNRQQRRSGSANRMTSSKSAGNIVAVDQYGSPVSPRQAPNGNNFDRTKRAKSDYIHQNDDDFQQQYLASFREAQSKENRAFRAPRQHRPQSGKSSNSSNGGTPRRAIPRSAVSPNDVFSPISNESSARSNRNGQGQVFRYDTPPSSTLSPYPAAHRPHALPYSPTSPGGSIEVKHVNTGQLRGFVLSAKSPQSQLPPPQRQTPLKSSDNIPRNTTRHVANDRDIEAKLKKLTQLENKFQQLCDDVNSSLSEKERLTADLSIARSKQQTRYSSGSSPGDSVLHRLEQQLGTVKAQLANATEKLDEMKRNAGGFEVEIRRLKSNVFEELKNIRALSDDVYNIATRQDKDTKRKLEWELGRVEFILEGINNLKSAISDKLDDIIANKDQESPLVSPTSPSTLSANGRSPRDVKRTSMERRSAHNYPRHSSSSSGGTPNATPVKKFYTLPGRGVPRSTSVDSVTAESLARPTSARSISSIASSTATLQRTKSASERLFNSQYGNQSSEKEAKDMKRLQKEILRNRRNNLMSGNDSPRRYPNQGGMTLPARSHMKVGIDVQMALKHHRMPKVLQRAKRDRIEAQNQMDFDIDDLERQVTGKEKRVPGGLYSKDSHFYNNLTNDAGQESSKADVQREEDVESDEIHVDVNLTHQTSGIVTNRAFSSSLGSGGGFSSARRRYERVSPPDKQGWGNRQPVGERRVFGAGGRGTATVDATGPRVQRGMYRVAV